MAMQVLTPEKWGRFSKDGKLFEKLVHEILKCLYPELTFKHTLWSHDGGKDFELEHHFFDSKMNVWAECKYHKNKLPIHDVAMTLFMAYVESVSTILFFSYSPVNENFQQYIDLYQKKSDKRIKIYADAGLEELILANKTKFDFTMFFDDISVQDCAKNNSIKCKYWVREFPNKNSSKHILHLNDTLTLDFSAMNETSEPVELQVELLPQKTNHFEVIESKNNVNKTVIQIPPYGINGKTYSVRLKNHGENIQIPKLQVTQHGKVTRHRISSKVNCRWLAETDIIGKKYTDLLRDGKSLLSNPSGSFWCLSGGSGTGKSRLIREFHTLAFAEEYKCINIDADNSHSLTAIQFFREIMSQIEELPLLSKKEWDEVEWLVKCSAEKMFTLKVLYDKSFDINNYRQQLVAYMVNVFNSKRIFLSLDNIQFYDEIVLEVIDKMLSSNLLKSKSILVLSANSDYLYQDTPADRIVTRMEWQSRKEPSNFLYRQLAGFQKDEAFDYLKACLFYNADSKEKDHFEYEKALRLIVDTYGTNPFFLQNYLLYLWQEGIITRTETTTFFISDCAGFQESITEIPSELLDLLSVRENTFLDYYLKDDMEQYNAFISYMGLVKWIPVQMIHELVELPNSILDTMLNLGFLKVNENGDYGFYHQQIELYFKKKYPYTALSKEKLQHFVNISSKQYNRQKYLEAIFLAEFQCNAVEKHIFENIVEQILKAEIVFDKTYHLCRALSVLIRNDVFILSKEKYIMLYKNMANTCICRFGIAKTQFLFQDLYSNFLHCYDEYNNHLSDIWELLVTHLRDLLNINHVDESLEKNNKLQEIIVKHFSEHPDYNALVVQLYQTRIFAYNNKNDLEAALEVSEKAIRLSENLQDKKQLIEAWLAKGDSFYSYKSSYRYKEQIIDCWNVAVEIYERQYKKGVDIFSERALYLNLLMRRILADIINGDCKENDSKIEELSKYFDKTDMIYFEIKIRLLYIIYMLCASSSNILSESTYRSYEQHIKHCVEICAIYGNQISYLDCFHLLAILQKSQGKNSFSVDNYQKSFTIFKQIVANQTSLERWAYFLADLIISMRSMNQKSSLPPKLWEFVDDKELSRYLKTLYQIAEDDLMDYIETQSPISAMYSIVHHVYFPKI